MFTYCSLNEWFIKFKVMAPCLFIKFKVMAPDLHTYVRGSSKITQDQHKVLHSKNSKKNLLYKLIYARLLNIYTKPVSPCGRKSQNHNIQGNE